MSRAGGRFQDIDSWKWQSICVWTCQNDAGFAIVRINIVDGTNKLFVQRIGAVN